MLDFFGHLGYASIMVGMFLLARRNAYGWVARLLGDAGWVALGFALGMSSIILWGLVFIAVDISGWRKWRETERARRLSDAKNYVLGRGVLFEKQIASAEWTEVEQHEKVFGMQRHAFLPPSLAGDDDLDTLLLKEEL
jgi:hypothetical protein